MKYIVCIILFVAINIMMPVYITPLVQDGANRHNGDNDVIINACFFLGLGTLVYSFVKQGFFFYKVIVVLIAVSFFYWCYKFLIIDCVKCSIV